MLSDFGFSRARVFLLTVFRRLSRRLADDGGAAALVLAAVIAIIAFTALSIFLNRFVGDREFARVQAGAAGQSHIQPALMVYFLKQTSANTLPCPDTSATPDGIADSCNSSGTTTGVVPWITLGLSKDDVVDAYGNFFTYVVSGVAKNICGSVTTDLAGSTATTTYTGQIIDATDLVLEDSSSATRDVAYALISHGKNRLGGVTSNGGHTAAPTGSKEVANAASAPSTIYSGPYSTDSTTYFDDQVYAPSRTDLEKVCKSLTPAGALNADIADNFDSGAATLDSTKFDTSGSGTPPTVTADARSSGNKVASFTDATSYLASASTFNFNPVVRPVYISALWTPDASSTGATAAGFSLATRATLADLAPGSDIFSSGTKSGITFRFDSRTANNISATGVANTISILDDTGALVTSGATTYNLITAKTYRIEAYDNGSDVWMRITQVDNAANTAAVNTSTTTDLSSTQNRVFAINGPAPSYIDEFIEGLPMLALENGATAGVATNGIAATSAPTNGTATGDLTLEAWIKPKALPGAGANATIVAQWDANASASASGQSYRLYLSGDNAGTLAFDVGDTIGGIAKTESFALGYKPALETWAHVAVTFAHSTKTVSFYVNGVLASTATSATDTNTGVNTGSQKFTVGAAFDGGTTIKDVFEGDISDVRVWSAARSATDIGDNFEERLAAAGSVTDLVVNWKLDNESGGLLSTAASASPSTIGTSGTLSGSATYVPVLAVYFRPLSTSFCPPGTIAGPYQCDFRTSGTAGSTSDFTFPSNLPQVFAKVWGAGGGGYDNTGSNDKWDTGGGPGGFSQGLIQSINGTPMAGLTVSVYVGGGGTGNSSDAKAGGGGGGSGIFKELTNTAGLVAGGGGGASISVRDVSGSGDCAPGSGTNPPTDSTRCGLGGLGGGVGTTPSHAPDQGSTCGGRGGDDDPTGLTSLGPPTTGNNSDCDDGGAPPPSLGHVGGGGTSGGAGGGPSFIAGGNGYDAVEADGNPNANAVGGGGGGGGAVGGEAGGYRDATARNGYGGGGGSGTADAGVTNASGAVGAYSSYNMAYSVNKTNNSPTLDTISPALTSSTVLQVGYGITGAGIPIGTTISAINVAANTITMSQNATNGSVVTITVIVPATPGGSTDPYYSPSYLGSALKNPGLGGTVGATYLNGHPGALVLIW